MATHKRSQKTELKVSIVYDMIKNAYENRQLTPSVREMQMEAGVSSTSTIHMYLRILENRGLILLAPGTNRGIMFPKDGEKTAVEKGAADEPDQNQA